MRNYNPRKRILVTGGAGFLGSHLIDRLLERGDEVVCVDNLFTGTKRNIDHLHDHPRFEFIRHDVTFPLYVEVDQIYNLACPACPDPLSARSGADHQDQRARRDQHAGSGQAAEGAHPPGEHQRGVRRPVGASADRGLLGQREPDRDRAAATTKASAAPRRCSSTTTASTSCDIRVARIFNTYGPRMHPNDGRVVSNFIVQALKGEDITLYGDGQQTRSFCYVDDLIEAFLRFMDLPAARRASRLSGPHQPRQPGRVHHPPAGGEGDRADRCQVESSSSGRCRRTTRCSASPTSRAHAST